MRKTLFISDLHLDDKEPHRTDWFLTFLSGPAAQSEALFILGDLFEYWIGDDALSDSARQVAHGVSTLASSGVPCRFLHGNRDFLLGSRYAGDAGLQLLQEPIVVDLYGTDTLLLHGDILCTDDLAYQAFRAQSRDPEWQASILALPAEERLRLAQDAREASRSHTGSVSMEIMDVNPIAVTEAFRKYGVARMIHGHTHRPARHLVDLDDVQGERLVLADWYEEASYLEVSAHGAVAKSL